MKIRMIDAIDVFGNGGYIDIKTMRYIAPKWFSDACVENNTGLSSDDYLEIARDKERYLTPPIIRLSGLHCYSAMQMGISHEQLVQMGFDNEASFHIFLPRVDGDNDAWLYGCSDAEWASIKVLDDLMRSRDQYYAYICNTNAAMQNIIRDWLGQNGIELYEDSPAQ